MLAGIALALLAGCTTGILYNRLDWLTHWYFSRQVTLTDEQSKSLREDLRVLLQWHRRSELPRYAALLEAFARDAAQPIGRERIELARTAVEGLWRDLVQQASPQAALWLADLTDTQLDELFESLAEEDDDRREEYCEADAATLDKRRERTIVSAIEDWTGRLSREQRRLVKDAVSELEPTGCPWVEHQQVFRRELRLLLAQRSRDTAFGEALARFLLAPEERWTDEYRRGFTANRERIVTLLADLDASLSPRQRARLTDRFASLARDLRDLSRVRGAHGELGDEHDLFGRLRRPRVPHVPGERVSADPV
ncbi:MAG TPA: DUF6279 family lipoprotein [Steroidobacteraceae bacterium]|nr:DUF6279 family lipoprotein [Steroidobacteraceae bacterium]